ncbi:ficolin-1-A-like [Physella acuta]|uniref:ficolin-1-A-like n=1 Tax=Physella acuta TaxID=109671 RepID=UPI0027DAFC59|nr:ficolin-1-A-like [Physella acuta]
MSVMNITLGSDNNYNPDDPKVYRSCKDVVSSQPRQLVKLSTGIVVMCDTQTDGGGWTIFQRRVTGDVSFNQGWNNYKYGFGDYSNGDFYLGNEHLYCMTSSKNYEMMVDLKCTFRNYDYTYASFRLSDESSGYTLSITKGSGNAGDSLYLVHNSVPFYTPDRDNPFNFFPMCATTHAGGWWFYGPTCFSGYLNGRWTLPLAWPSNGIACPSPQTSEMKIRPK